MADNIDNSQSTEYKPSNEQAAGYSELDAARNQQIIRDRIKRLLIPVSFMITIYLVYSILSWFSGRKSDDGLKQQELVNTPAVSQQASQPVVVAPSAAEVQMANFSQEVKDQLSGFAQQLSENRDQLTAVKDAIGKNQTDIENMRQAFDQVNSSVQQVVGEVQKMLVAQKKPKRVVKAKPIVAYNVKAIVPGRVWLESSSGNTISLRAGDKLDGYGVVELISPKQGLVVTSSGRTIQYGVNDV